MSPGPKRMVVTGRQGQVVQSLLERGRSRAGFDVVALGRPQFDLLRLDEIEDALHHARPDVIVSAAAYTAVDQAEAEEDTAHAINSLAAGRIAAAAARLAIPVIHLSTDYVFDGTNPDPYIETDREAPIGAYGRSKLGGEHSIADVTEDYVILRTAWVYSPFGKNFLKTMLRLAESRDTVSVVSDQIGNPTSALDIADGIMAVAANLLASSDEALRGVFHMTGSGQASWADFAELIFTESSLHGGATAKVERIASSQYPTPARRPANSRLDCTKLARLHQVRLPDWRQSAAEIVARLVQPQTHGRTRA